MRATIHALTPDVLCRAYGPKALEARLQVDSVSKLAAWAKQYDEAVRLGLDDNLAAIGRSMFQWLDTSRWASAWIAGDGARELEIVVVDAGVSRLQRGSAGLRDGESGEVESRGSCRESHDST